MGVKASNYFMPAETLSDKGPGGGGWIHMNSKLQVTTKAGEVWGKGVVFAVGDCNYGCIGSPGNWVLNPIPKISYPSEEQALQACHNLIVLDKQKYGYGGCCGTSLCLPKKQWIPGGHGELVCLLLLLGLMMPASLWQLTGLLRAVKWSCGDLPRLSRRS